LTFEGWVAEGPWQIQRNFAKYEGVGQPGEPAGTLIAPNSLDRGSISVTVSFGADSGTAQARIMFGFQPATGSYYTAGLGGYNALYVVDEYTEAGGVRPLLTRGRRPAGGFRGPSKLVLGLKGRYVTLAVNEAPILEAPLPVALGRAQVGLFAWAETTVTFEDLSLHAEPPKVFVVMQYGGEYDALYASVIKPAAEGVEGLAVSVDRVDERQRPGSITEDIELSIADASVVIAEVTPDNPNVFYEVGYARAHGVPIIFLAKTGRQLPFDIIVHRTIFYDGVDPAQEEARQDLKDALSAVLEGRQG
jgi:hypothetical protein